MTAIEKEINFLKESWSKPKKASYDHESFSFELGCIFNQASLEVEILKTFTSKSVENFPAEYKQFLSISNGTFLFLDQKYGQAELNLYSLKDFDTKAGFWLSSCRNNTLVIDDLINIEN